MISAYYSLTKPGIIMGNIVTAVAGFAVASRGHIESWLFFATLLGLSCIIASACVCNNYIDRYSDAKMARTKNRALVQGLISEGRALFFATILGACGTFILAFYTNLLTTAIALTGFFVYVILYSGLKQRSTYATLIGSIAGAVPPVVGYCAVTGRFDIAALLLFLIVVFWQMPHFFAIAMYRLDDYTAAAIPVLPVIKGTRATKVQMLVYIIAFSAVSIMPTFLGYTGYLYLTVAALLGFLWLRLCLQGFSSSNDTSWARKMFLFSLVVVMTLSIALSVDVV